MNFSEFELEKNWQHILGHEFDKPYMQQLQAFLTSEYKAGKTIFPASHEIFNALNTTAFDDVKVVILGQDPYHGNHQAHGLSFSVPVDVTVPPSLRNIYKELQRSMEVSTPNHGCLMSWAEQGVLLLNATLTVEQACAGSHQKKGWEVFTDNIIYQLASRRENIVFMLWGAYAQKKGKLLDAKKHCVLVSSHPSPLSAHRGFMGSGHFVKANDYLQKNGQAAIDWSVPDVL